MEWPNSGLPLSPSASRPGSRRRSRPRNHCERRDTLRDAVSVSRLLSGSATKINQYKYEELLANDGIIRNKLKIQSAIANANAVLQVKQEWGSFSNYIWHFVNGVPIKNHWKSAEYLPTTSLISDELSKDLKKRGFKFVGSTICYAFMQAVGMVNDHTADCFCYEECKD